MGEREISVALAGNANVGKSVLFNQLTGLSQTIGNWPGKTVERAEGVLRFKGYTIRVVDLPGIYSLSTYSIEEAVSRDYIANEKPDLVINVLDASILERNLFFTLQLIELGRPLILALNQMDLAKKKGIDIDPKKLEEALGIPVIPMVATKGIGISELLDKVLEVTEGKVESKPTEIRYGREIEDALVEVERFLGDVETNYPRRWLAIKLLEGDEEISDRIGRANSPILRKVEEKAREIERLHGEPTSLIMISERYTAANKVTNICQRVTKPQEVGWTERLEDLTINRVWGYPLMAMTLVSMLFAIYFFGNLASDFLGSLLGGLKPAFEGLFGVGAIGQIVWDGVVQGVIAGITIALPYILPFYLLLAVLEDSGYLARIAFLMDSIMHKIGLHGKAFIPMILAYGCNVPACLGCRIMETEEERLLAAFVTTLIPCAARTVVILGVVGAFLGLPWALLLYAINLAVVFALGRIAFRMFVGKPVDLIMEMPSYRTPSWKVVARQTWFRVKDFVYVAFPIIIAGSLALETLKLTGLLSVFADAMSPLIVGWLGLPAITGIVLIFGVLRKELTLIMLAALAGTTNLALILSPTQMIVFALVIMFYIPCVSTIAALAKEFGYRKALYITLFEVAFALLLGGIALRILTVRV